MIQGYGFIGNLAARNNSVQDVIAIDAVILQSSGIKLSDAAGLTTELALSIAYVVPYLIETTVGFVFDSDLSSSKRLARRLNFSASTETCRSASLISSFMLL